jgi:hypothetical protein
MKTIEEITSKEVIDLLETLGVQCDNLYFEGNKWSYCGGFLEGESKWCIRCNLDPEPLPLDKPVGIFIGKFNQITIPPLAALKFLVSHEKLKPGEYLLWCSW